MNDFTVLHDLVARGKLDHGTRAWYITNLEIKLLFLATKCGSWACRVWYECTFELRVKAICKEQGSVPLVNKYISLQSCALYISTSFGTLSCLKSGSVCALYTALHILRTAFVWITSNWRNQYWQAEPQISVPYERCYNKVFSCYPWMQCRNVRMCIFGRKKIIYIFF